MTLYRTKLLQHYGEHEKFTSLLKSENVRSYMEIGSMYGGSLWRVANALPKGSRIVSLDYPIDTPDALPHLEGCVHDLIESGYDAHLIVGNSADPDIVERAKALGPFDCVFIDGSHYEKGVRADWANYGGMGRIIAFHDIAWNSTWKSNVPGRTPKVLGVPDLWNELKPKYRHKEIKHHMPSNYYGIGVLWVNG